MATQNYPACERFVLKQEGGNTDVRGDPGGRTGRGGVTHITYDNYRDRKGLPLQDVFKISSEEIADIYRAQYWNPIDGDNLPVGVDLCLFDISINSGPLRAKQIWGRVAKTESLVAQVHSICMFRLVFLHSLRTWGQFGRGWGRRVSGCEATAMNMLAAIDPAVKTGMDKAKAKKAVKTSHTKLGAGIFASAFAAVMHFVAGIPPGVLAAVLVIAAVVVIHGFAAAKAAVAKVPLVPVVPAAPPTGLIVTSAGVAVPQWPPMTSTRAAEESHLSAADIEAVVAAVVDRMHRQEIKP